MKVLDVVLIAKMAAQTAHTENRTEPNRRDYAELFRGIKDVPPMTKSVRGFVSELYQVTFCREIGRLK